MGGLDMLSVVPSVFTASVSSETLLAIPFFILAGVIMEYAGISRRLVDFAHACVGGRKHGLAIVVVLAAFFFSAISDRKSTRLNSSHVKISYAVFCLKKK